MLAEQSLYNIVVPIASQPKLTGSSPSTPTVGSDRARDSNGVLQNGRSVATVNTPRYGNRDLTIDFGFQVEPPITIGDCVCKFLLVDGLVVWLACLLACLLSS